MPVYYFIDSHKQSVKAFVATVEKIPEDPSDLAEILSAIQHANHSQVWLEVQLGFGDSI